MPKTLEYLTGAGQYVEATEDLPYPVSIAGANVTVSGALSISDGNDATLGAIADAAVADGAAGTISAKLRTVTTDLATIKTALTTLQGYVDGVEGALATLNTNTDGLETLLAGGLPAALGQGTMAQSLRVVLPSNQSAIPVTIADAADAALGAIADAAATQGGTGTISAKLRLLTSQINSLLGYVDGLEGQLPSSLTGAGNLKVSIEEGGASFTLASAVDTELTTADLDTGGGADIRAVVGLVRAESGGGVLVGSANPLPVSIGAAVDTELTTADLDTGAGTDTRAVVGMVLAASGGGALVGTANPMPVSDNGSTLSVDDGAGSLTVDGTVAATQSGTWTVQPGNTANTTAWKVDGSAVTQPVNDAGGSLSIDDGGGNISIDDGGNSITVDGNVSITGQVTVDTELPTAAALADATANPTAPAVGAFNLGYNGTTWDRLQVDSNKFLKINATGSVAHDGADSGNPVKIGARAINAEISAVAANDRTDLLTDLVGKLITLPYANPENSFCGASAADITDTTSTQVIAAHGSLRRYITSISVSNLHASVATRVDILDGNGGTVLWSGAAAASGGGYVVTFPVPLRCSAATRVDAKCGTTGAAVRVAIAGYNGV